MNSYFDKAVNFIDKKVGKDFGIVQDSIQDLPDFYSFTYQSRKYLKTGNFEDMVIGQGSNFINKSDNRFFSYGSGQGFEDSLKDLRNKIAKETEIKKVKPEFDIQKQFDLRISTVTKKQLLVDTLLKFGTTYIIPEVVGDSIFRIAEVYKKKLLFDKLTHLPRTFHGLNQYETPNLLIELMKNSACEFDLIKRQERNLAKYVDKATKVDLEPIW